MKTKDWIVIVGCVCLIAGSMYITIGQGFRNATARDIDAIIERLDRIERKVSKGDSIDVGN